MIKKPMQFFAAATDWISKKYLKTNLVVTGQWLTRSSCLNLADANSMMSACISASLPFAAGKLGSVERSFLLALMFPGWLSSRETLANIQDVDPRKIGRCPAGIFPYRRSMIELAMREISNSLCDLDLLACWDLFAEQLICKRVNARIAFANSMSIFNIWSCLENGLTPESVWLASCKGKAVLLITPFQQSIDKALNVHGSFYDSAFGASTVRFVCPPRNFDNINVDESCLSHSWIRSLSDLKKKVESIEFDVCLVGCGAYSLPLCSYIKRIMAKPAIHLGGDLHHNFGITGGRWSNTSFPSIQEKYLRNDPIRVVESERPPDHVLECISQGDHYW